MASNLALVQRWKKNLSDLLGPQADSVLQGNDPLVAKLHHSLEGYLDEDTIAEIYRAVVYGKDAHRGQKRTSGEDYITHPIAVAQILGDMRMDDRTIIAAILHDVIEDTDITRDELADSFGEHVASLVDGVSKISQLEQVPREHAEAASFRKMFMAMAKDIRVIIIKLADRLHNMSTLSALSNDRRRRISKQTLEIYAPMANRLGMRELAQNLEDLSLLNLHPRRYQIIERQLRNSKRGRRNVIREACETLSEKLELNNLQAEVYGREKSVYSIYRKVKRKKLSLRDIPDIQDIHAIRVITPKRLQCYQALGIIHQAYNPKPGRFKDYIAIPKINGYQSLHTVVIGPKGSPVEIQVRSQSMHRTAEKGVASHWLYSTETRGEHAPQQLAQQWLDSFLESQDMSSDSGEYLEHLRADLYPDEVYVFTPKGDIKRLPLGATALDFAYAVHSGIGNHSIGATINQSNVPLHEPLRNGDHVEIRTSRHARPVPSWLHHVVSSKAKVSIRHFLNRQKTRESLRLGRKLLRTARTNQGYRRVYVSAEHKAKLLDHLQIDSWDHLLTDIGIGKRPPALVAKQLIAVSLADTDKPDYSRSSLTIDGTEGLLITYPSCCHPIPGDKIIGTSTKERGVVVHRAKCGNIKAISHHPENYFHLNWSPETQGQFQVQLNVLSENQPGVLATVSNIIARHHSNINKVNVEQCHTTASSMTFIIEVTDRIHLASIMRQVHAEATVSRVTRQ